MFIAKSLRRENIAEYVLYMWQIEDLLRALEFDFQRIYDTIITPQTNLTDEQRQMAFFWYEDIVNMLLSEGKREKGHMSHIEHVVADLSDTHLKLLRLPVGIKYAEMFAKLEPELDKLRKSIASDEVSDIELCFMALYSVMLLRLKGESDNNHIKDVIELISPVIAMLSSMYKKIETGEIDMFKGA